MQQDETISQAYQAHRPDLVDLAFRMLGDIGAAEDAVQDAFSRLMRADVGEIEDYRGWLIVVTSRNFTRDLGIQWGFNQANTPQNGNTTGFATPITASL